MKYFYDTEFWERGNAHPITPISIGLVAEDGRELYLEIAFDWALCDNEWLHKNVKPHLRSRRFVYNGAEEGDPDDTDEDSGTVWAYQAVDRIREFVGKDKPELWGYYADYDHVVLCQLFGSMIALPEGWPMYTLDLKQWCLMLGNPRLPEQEGTEHNALEDARWTRQAWTFLRDYETEQKARAALIHAGEWGHDRG